LAAVLRRKSLRSNHRHPSGLLSQPSTVPFTGMTPSQQKWADALGGFSAALRDAGAYLQHQPEAAGNVAAFETQRQRLRDAIGQTNYNTLLLGMVPKPAPAPVQLFPNGLPPAAAAWLLLQRMQQNRITPALGPIQAGEQDGNPAQTTNAT
jgi:hypothetical protein